MFKSDSLAKIAPALVEAQRKLGSARKDSKNPFFKSSYADLNSVIDASVDTLNEANIAVLQVPVTENGKSVLRTMLLHSSGEYVASDTDIVSAKVNDPQAYGSAISYARRYGLQAIVTLKTAEDDGEAAMGRAKPASTWTPKPAVQATPHTTQPIPVVSIKDTSGGEGGMGAAAAVKAKVSFARKVTT